MRRGGASTPLARPRVSILVFAVLVTYCCRLSLPSIDESTPEGLSTTKSDDDDYKKQNQIKKRIKYSDFSHQKMAALKTLRSSCIYMQ